MMPKFKPGPMLACDSEPALLLSVDEELLLPPHEDGGVVLELPAAPCVPQHQRPATAAVEAAIISSEQKHKVRSPLHACEAKKATDSTVPQAHAYARNMPKTCGGH
jgi:hypothetical protein